jgi:hypothetical protein
LADIRNVSERAGTTIVTLNLYAELGKFDPSTPTRRFGTWNKTVTATHPIGNHPEIIAHLFHATVTPPV